MGTNLKSYVSSQAPVRTFGRTLAFLLPLVGVLGVAVPYFLGFRTLALLATYVAVPSVLAPVFYRYAAVGGGDPLDTTTVQSARRGTSPYVGRLLLAAYLVLQGVAVLLLALNDVRPLGYYAVVAVIALVVLVQIIRRDPREGGTSLILGQVVLLHLNLVWGVTLKYNYFVGRTDVLGHVGIVRVLLDERFLAPATSGFYRSFPLWHVFGAAEHLLLGSQFEPRTTVFVMSGIVYAAVPVGVYLVARRLFDGERIALTAALLTSIEGTVVFNGMYAIPRSIAAFLFVVALVYWARGDGRSNLLLGLLAVAIATYHPVSLPFVFVILAVDFTVRRVLAATGDSTALPSGTSYLILSVFVIVQAGYWLFFAEYLLEHLVSVVVQQSAPGQVNTGVFSRPLQELANYVQNSILLLFLLVGALVGTVDDRVSGPGRAVLLSALVLAAVSFPGPHLLLSQLAESFNVLRFAQYSFPFIAIAAAYGLVALVRRVNPSTPSRRAVTAVALALFVALSFTAVSNDFVASDNPVVERQFYTSYISDAEERSMRTVGSIAAGNVSSDYVGTRYYTASSYREKARILGVNEDGTSLYMGAQDDLVLVREGELQRRPLQLWMTDEYTYDVGYLGGLEYVERDSPAWTDLRSSNRVYDAGTATAYQRSPVTSNAFAADTSGRTAD